MKLISALLCAVFVTSAGLPVAAMAGSIGPRATNYAQFQLNMADVEAMKTEADKACLASALRTPDDLNLQVACNKTMAGRLNTRVDRAIATATPRMRRARLRQFNAEQANWASSHTTRCETYWARELNTTSNSYGLAVSQCDVLEIYRRALWIERLR